MVWSQQSTKTRSEHQRRPEQVQCCSHPTQGIGNCVADNNNQYVDHRKSDTIFVAKGRRFSFKKRSDPRGAFASPPPSPPQHRPPTPSPKKQDIGSCVALTQRSVTVRTVFSRPASPGDPTVDCVHNVREVHTDRDAEIRSSSTRKVTPEHSPICMTKRGSRCSSTSVRVSSWKWWPGRRSPTPQKLSNLSRSGGLLPSLSPNQRKIAIAKPKTCLYVIVVDRSWSSRRMGTAAQVTKGLNQLFDATRRRDADSKGQTTSHVVLVTYDDQVHLVRSGPLASLNPIEEREMQPASSAAFFDALSMAIDVGRSNFTELLDSPTSIQLLLFTDGLDNASKKSMESDAKAKLEQVTSLREPWRIVAASTDVSRLSQVLPRRATANIAQVVRHRLGFTTALDSVAIRLNLPVISQTHLCTSSKWDIILPKFGSDVLPDSRMLTILPAISDVSAS